MRKLKASSIFTFTKGHIYLFVLTLNFKLMNTGNYYKGQGITPSLVDRTANSSDGSTTGVSLAVSTMTDVIDSLSHSLNISSHQASKNIS